MRKRWPRRTLATGLAVLLSMPAIASAHHPGGDGPWSLIMLAVMVLSILAVWLFAVFTRRRESNRTPVKSDDVRARTGSRQADQ